MFLFFQLSKKYGSVFTVYFGNNKVVVLAGYKVVKEALVSNTKEFGDRNISPIFYETNQGHGKSFRYKILNLQYFYILEQRKTINYQQQKLNHK